MNAMGWLFGHDYALLVSGVFFAAGIGCLVFFHSWLMPKAREMQAAGSPETYSALAGLWKTLYPAALCFVTIAIIGIIYHSQV